MMHKIICVVALVVGLGTSLKAQIFPELGGQRAGISALTFLKNDINPRAVGMGGLNVASFGDAYSINSNPALLNDLPHTKMAVSNRTIVSGMNQSFAAASFSIQEGAQLGAFVNSLYSDRMEKRTEFQPKGTGEYFYVSNTAAGISYAKVLSQAFSVGVTAKFINESIAEYNDNTAAVDLGFRYRTDYRNLSFAVALNNFGLNTSFSGNELEQDFNRNQPQFGDDPLSTLFAFGLSLDVFNEEKHKLRAGVQLNHPNDNAESLHLGGEYSFRDMFFGRFGYKINVDNEVLPTFGFGAAVPFGHSLIRFNYGANLAQGLGIHPGFQGSAGESALGVVHVVGISLIWSSEQRPSLSLPRSRTGYHTGDAKDDKELDNEDATDATE